MNRALERAAKFKNLTDAYVSSAVHGSDTQQPVSRTAIPPRIPRLMSSPASCSRRAT